MAVDPQAINDAAHGVLPVVKRMRDISAAMITPIAEDVLPHADTIVELKGKAAGLKAAWESARDAMDAALIP